MAISQQLATIQKQIQEITANCGREPNSVTLIAVSKTKPLDAIFEAVQAGQKDFGENYAQEFLEKHDALAKDQRKESILGGLPLRFHFIGHLQSRKAKDIVGKVSLIHTLDSIKLATAINKEAEKHNIIQDCLVQVMVAKEETKSGISPEELPAFLEECVALPHIKITGLMCIPPPEENPENSRPYFKKMKMLLDEMNILGRAYGHTPLQELSMGMSHDYKVAIEEGATLVRVGTAIFGARS